MARYDGRDYIYLVWKEPTSRKQFLVGKLSKNGKYEFKYDFEINEALENGFDLLIAFDDINKTYESDKLFPSFASRIPDRRRKDIQEILIKYGLNSYDEYELLKKSGGKLPIDYLLFIDPIIEENEFPIIRDFYAAGPRHHLGCEGYDCNRSLILNVSDELFLEMEPNNIHDKYAIKIIDKNGEWVGHIPRYYNKELIRLLDKGANYSLQVIEFNKEKNCNECLLLKIDVHE